MDGLPLAGEGVDWSQPHLVNLTFDMEFLGVSPVAAPLRIVANGETLLDTTFAHTGTQAYPGTTGVELFPAGSGSEFLAGEYYSFHFSFTLYPQVRDGDPAPCCANIIIDLDQPGYAGSNPLHFSSISLDWSQAGRSPAPPHSSRSD